MDKVRKIMKREYIAVLLAGFIAATSASASSYMHTVSSIAVQDVRLVAIEGRVQENTNINKELYKAIQKMSEDNHKTQIALTKIASIIEYRKGERDGRP